MGTEGFRSNALKPTIQQGGWHGQNVMMGDLVPHIRVVAAVIEQEGRFLITQRRLSGVLAGLWEFPSGKVEPGESDEDALRRELRERVGVDVEVGRSTAHRSHRYEGYVVDLILYRAAILPGQEPRPIRVADLRWVQPQELENYAFPPADQVTTDLLLGLKPDPTISRPGHIRSVRSEPARLETH